MSWLFLFSAHRELFERAVRSEGMLAERDRVIYDLTKQLEQRQIPEPASPMTLLEEFRDHVLQEIPYPDGRVPESAWLTPAYPER